jgi:acetylornithine/N-succinyldiaminopimelate aminotransferase
MNFSEIKETEDRYQVASYAKLGISVERGRGALVWTSEGEEYLDLYGGHAVCAAGHSHPKVVRAIREQAESVLFYSNLVYSSVRARAAEKLVDIAPPAFEKAFFCNSGTEANENAMRMARLVTGREKIITFEGGFHGRTADSISATFLGKYRELGRPNVPGHVSAVFGDLESVESAADEDTAAIMLEPIQSMAGVIEADPEFFRGLRKICDRKGIVLIFDEVQTGVGRTGEWFFSGSEYAGGANADIVTLAKSLGSGIPVGACLVTDAIAAEIGNGDLGTTFGGGMLAMAAVLATLEAIEEDGMRGRAKDIEAFVRAAAERLPTIVSVRGKGCLLGIEFDRPASEIHASLLEKRIITGTSSDKNVLRLLMPMCVTDEQLETFLRALEEIV